MQFYTNVVKYRNRIHHFYYRDGKKHHTVENYNPTIAVRCNEKTGWTSYFGDNVKHVEFSSIREYTDYVKAYKNTIPLYGEVDPVYQYISDQYSTELGFDPSWIRVLKIDIEVNSDEGFPYPYAAAWPIVSIAIKDSKTKRMFVLGLKEYDPKQRSVDVDVSEIYYKRCRNEESLLVTMIELFAKLQPDVLIGWNSSGFDFPYIVNRIENVLGEEHKQLLSPVGGRVSVSTKEIKDKLIYRTTIPGIALLDYMEMYKKYLPGEKESFALDAIAELELGENKIDYSEYDNLRILWARNHQKFIDYNMIDVELIDRLDAKLGLLNLHFMLAYKTKCNFEDVMSPVKTWDCYIYNVLKADFIAVPPHRHQEKVKYPGAYVHDPIPGLKGWVASTDLNSLYPHIKMQWNISPETIVSGMTAQVNTREIDQRFFSKEIDVDPNFILAGNGQYFRKDIKGFIPTLLREIYEQRSAIKKEMLKHKQELVDLEESVKQGTCTMGQEELAQVKKELQALVATKDITQLALKILLNSEYGATGSNYFRYYDIRLASAVTMSGQLAINWARRRINEFFKREYNIEEAVCYVDTDSLYFHVDVIADGVLKEDPNASKHKIVDAIDKFCKEKIEVILEEGYQDLAKYVNANECKMVMKREKIAERGLWVAKKRYATLVWDDEGVRFPDAKLKVTGIEIVRSSTPKAVKPFLREAVITLMRDPNSLSQFVRYARAEFEKLSPEEIAFPRSVNGLRKYSDSHKIYAKGCPIGPKAALIYNHYIKTNKLEDQYAMIEEGEKIKFLYTRTPNPFSNADVFGFLKRFPLGGDNKEFVDYRKQFDKAVKATIENFAESSGLNIQEVKKTNLADLF